MAEQGPTTRQRRLAAELQRLREAAGLTQARAAGLLGWDRTKLVRIEGVRRIPSVADVEVILATYGGTNEAIKLALVQLARDIRQRGWWAPFGDVFPGSYAELENAASRIRTWQVQLLPGLFQTEDYARALIRASFPSDPADVDRRVQARMRRQELLTREDPPVIDAIVTEEVLRRPVGGTTVMRQQLTVLLEVAERPNVSLRVVPLPAAHYPAIGQGSMVLFELNQTPMDLSVAYLETIAGAMFVEDISQVRLCSVMFDNITDVALPAPESAALIAAISKEIHP